ncbi:MAG: hypothetical protein QW372_04940 [Nitrososphaerales archaeon]
MTESKKSNDKNRINIPLEIIISIVEKIDKEKELIPTRTSDGQFTYATLDELKLSIEQTELLEYIRNEGLISEEVIETTLLCPKCSKSNFIPIFKCLNCGSSAIIRDRLIEHKAGGHMHPESTFKKGDLLICPSCGKVLKNPTEYIVLGSWFVCKKCGAKYAQLIPEFKCLNDGTIFSLTTSDFKSLNKITLTDKGRRLLTIDKALLIGEIVKNLEKIGKVEREVTIQGKSGTKHVFDLSLTLKEQRLLIDVAFEKDFVDTQIILSNFAKIIDVEINDYLIIVWPKLTPSALSLVNFYKLKYIEISNLNELGKINNVLTGNLKSQ